MTQRSEPHPVPMELQGFLAVRVEAHRTEAEAREVAITTESAVAGVMIDPEMIGRVVDNLLSNAIRHTPAHGKVSISATASASGLRLTVADGGVGVAPELRERLFEPFVTGRADGTGLGLAIARELADAHGGHLTLLDPGSAMPRRGAVFALDLPGAVDVERPDRR
jgi:signal transduction histidine kinase